MSEIIKNYFFSPRVVDRAIRSVFTPMAPMFYKLGPRTGGASKTLYSKLVFCILTAGISLPIQSQNTDDSRAYFQIPQLSAEAALNTFAKQAQVQLLFDFAIVQNFQTNAIEGEYLAWDALQLLVEDIGLEPIRVDGSSYSVVLADTQTRESETMSNNRNLFFAAFAAIFSVGGATDVVAQTDTPTATIEEVLVTARRREENLQEVPIAITAISSEDLEMRSIENIEDLQLALPNVDIRGQGRQGAAGGNFTVRGVGGVARYIDGVALTGNQGSLSNVIELERIEVLRGPQGTYFGKNAIGGAIQYITQKPAEEFGARVKLTAGSFDRQDAVINVDLPINDTLKAKVTAASLYRGGYVESTVINQSYGEQDNDVLTGMLQWTPSDNFDALFTATSNKEQSAMQAYVLFDVVDPFTPQAGSPNPQTPAAYNNPAVSAFPFTDELYAFGKNEQYLNATDYTGTGVDFDSFATSATLTWDINDDISLKSITGTRDLHSGVWQDSDATFLGYFNTWSYNEIQEVSQEFQLYGGNDRLDWIVGAYYQNSKSTNVASNWQRVELTGGGPLGPRLRNTLGTNDTTDTAIFAEAVYQVTDQLSVTLGARYSKEDLEAITLTPTNPQGDLNTPTYSTEGTVSLDTGEPLIFPAEFSATTPRVAIQYQVNDDIMVYAGMSQGFNGGGVNGVFEPTQPNNGISTYSSEILTNSEIGFRSDLMNDMLRLNATYFFGDWDDIHIGETLTPGQMTTTNGGAAEISGIEIEGQWRVTDDVFVDFTYGHLETKYTDTGISTAVNVGTTFPFSPEDSYSIGAQWNKSLTDGGNVVSRVDWGWISDYETFTEEQFQTEIGPNEAYGLLSGRITYTPPSGDYTLAVFGTNLTDQWYRVGGFAAVLAGIDQGVVARPREIGVSLTMDF